MSTLQGRSLNNHIASDFIYWYFHLETYPVAPILYVIGAYGVRGAAESEREQLVLSHIVDLFQMGFDDV